MRPSCSAAAAGGPQQGAPAWGPCLVPSWGPPGGRLRGAAARSPLHALPTGVFRGGPQGPLQRAPQGPATGPSWGPPRAPQGPGFPQGPLEAPEGPLALLSGGLKAAVHIFEGGPRGGAQRGAPVPFCCSCVSFLGPLRFPALHAARRMQQRGPGGPLCFEGLGLCRGPTAVHRAGRRPWLANS